MKSDLKISASVVINAGVGKVWDVLTVPAKIMLYLGSNTTTDWMVGSEIVWEGEHGGHSYRNKGKVLANDYGKLLKFEYWSGFGGTPDLPENYSVISYYLEDLNERETKFTYEREHIPTKEEKEMFEAYLPVMLGEIKRLAEE